MSKGKVYIMVSRQTVEELERLRVKWGYGNYDAVIRKLLS